MPSILMKKLMLVFVLAFAVILSGCSAPSDQEPELKYDEVDVLVYQSCINAFLNSAVKGNFDFTYTGKVTLLAAGNCKELLPKKK